MDRIDKIIRVMLWLLAFGYLCDIGMAQTSDTIDIQLTSDYTLKKPNILSTKSLTSSEQQQVKTALSTGRRLIHTELMPVKNDYQNDFDRGTVEYTPKCRNYSFHKIVIPDGTTVSESNFSQRVAHTQAISGKNLTFNSCNLVNVELDPTWIVNDCNTCQIQRVITDTKDIGVGLSAQKELTVSHQVEKDGKFEEVQVDKETYATGDDYSLALLRYAK